MTYSDHNQQKQLNLKDEKSIVSEDLVRQGQTGDSGASLSDGACWCKMPRFN
jgi:hypothetical protein